MNRTCLHCHTSLEGKRPNAKYCSKSCKSKASASRCYGRQRGEDIPLIEYRKPRADCIECGQELPTTQHLLYCSNECRAAHKLSKCKDLVLWQPKPKRERKQNTGAPFSFVSGTCRDCNTPFTYQRQGKRRISNFCSAACMFRAVRRNGNHHRRARIKTARTGTVIRSQVFERDNYTCQLCHHPVDTDAHWNTDWYPSLDHILPLASGGVPSMENLQTAHRICNSIKGNKLTA